MSFFCFLCFTLELSGPFTCAMRPLRQPRKGTTVIKIDVPDRVSASTALMVLTSRLSISGPLQLNRLQTQP
ncbi:hypothetical protein IR083_03500 [Dysgonomonas sp. GY75]|uniref:hypothetical protein n=1 Tax=Dysgonomonas sp. GY75 TaxID=2780419 RepID=UPI00188371D6|nr:hypothetical protein [Dysgonomonas sp. GY75]MBF0647883.1 hypothetical protein [Dysgonomonas sp. GY75]